MLKALAFRFSAMSILVFMVGIVFTMFLTYAVIGLVALTTFLMEVISRGGYG